VFVEVPDERAVRTLAAPGRVCVTWLRRDRGQLLETAVDAWLVERGDEADVYRLRVRAGARRRSAR